MHFEYKFNDPVFWQKLIKIQKKKKKKKKKNYEETGVLFTF